MQYRHRHRGDRFEIEDSQQPARANHQTDPPTFWLVSETDVGRVLKIVYIQRGQDFIIKTAYEPKDGSDVLYQRLCARRRN
jgi:hypothetical protein